MNWLKRHPLQAVSFAIFNTFIACLAGCRPDLWVPLLVMFIIGLFVFVLLYQIYKPLMLLLAALLMMADGAPPMTAAQRKGGEIVVGVIVICVGTYCVYRLARFCNQHFPKPPGTNQVNNVAQNLTPSQEAGASFPVSVSCDNGESYAAPGTFTINAAVIDGELYTGCSMSTETASMDEFLAGLSAHGLYPGAGASYSLNGQPVSSLPIGNGGNAIAGTEYRITVMGSFDMQTWSTLFVTTAGEGTAFQIQDSMGTKLFYRLEME